MDKIKGKSFCTRNKGMQKTQYVSPVDAEKLHFVCQYFRCKKYTRTLSFIPCAFMFMGVGGRQRQTDRGK
jgi:hypothetical protein